MPDPAKALCLISPVLNRVTAPSILVELVKDHHSRSNGSVHAELHPEGVNIGKRSKQSCVTASDLFNIY